MARDALDTTPGLEHISTNPNANVQLIASPAQPRNASHPATGPLPQGRCAQPSEELAEQLRNGLCVSHMTCSSAIAVESAGWSCQQWPVQTKPAWHSSSCRRHNDVKAFRLLQSMQAGLLCHATALPIGLCCVAYHVA